MRLESIKLTDEEKRLRLALFAMAEDCYSNVELAGRRNTIQVWANLYK